MSSYKVAVADEIGDLVRSLVGLVGRDAVLSFFPVEEPVAIAFSDLESTGQEAEIAYLAAKERFTRSSPIVVVRPRSVTGLSVFSSALMSLLRGDIEYLFVIGDTGLESIEAMGCEEEREKLERLKEAGRYSVAEELSADRIKTALKDCVADV